MMKNIVVFTPTYNEIENIETFIKQVFEVLPDCKLLVVDDNSPDGTAQKVEQLKKVYPNLYLVVRKEKRGRGYAGIEGFKKCIDLGADIIVEMDADLSHSPYELPKLIEVLEKNPEVDIVVGSRYIEGGKDNERSIVRKLISLFSRIYIKLITGIPLEDVTSGYKVYRRKVIETILQYLSASDPFIVTEVNYLCKMFKFKFFEVPIEFHKRLYGKSKLSLWKLLKYLFKVKFLVVKWFLKDKYNLLFVKILLLTTILRLVLSGMFGLTDDESHYWQYAQYLDFSYYDHPPMVGYLIYLSTKIFGNNLYAIRLPAIFCFTIAIIYFYRLVKEIFGSQHAFYSSLLLNFIPVAFVGSIITIPETLLGMFWMMYMFYFYKFVLAKDIWLLYFCGILLGLALLSKYTAVFLFIGSIFVILIDPKLRKFLLKKDFYIYCLISITIFSPVILWNVVHKFVSFKYQFGHAVGTKVLISIKTFVENFGFQSAYFSPVVFVLIWYSIIYAFINKNVNKFLLYFVLPGLLFFVGISFKNKLLPHWPAVFYFTLIPYIRFLDKKRILYYVSLVSSVLITFFVILITLFGIIKIPEKYSNADTPDKLYGWDIAAAELNTLLKKYQSCFVFTHRYYVAGQIRFALAKYFENGSIPEVFCIDDYLNQYDFWDKNLNKFDGKDAIYITEGRFPEEDVLGKLPFKEKKLVSIVTFRKNRFWSQRVFKFYLCKNFMYKNLLKEFIQQEYNNSLSVTEYFRNYDKIFFLKINQSKFYQKNWFRVICYVITNLGNGVVLLPLIALVLFLIDKKNFVPELISFLIIVLLGGIIIQFLKHTFDKPRPLKLFQEILHQPINVIGEQLREFGFPSGHTFLAFSSAVYISDKVKKKYITILVFFLALLVGISRILVGAHFLSDVIGGIVIGILFSWICLKIKHKLL